MEKTGFSPKAFLERLTFNLISRVIGFLVRSFLIFIGLLAELALVFLGVAFLLIWQFAFLLSWPIYKWIKGKSENEVEKILSQTRDPAAILLMLVSRPIGRFVIERLGIEGKEINGLVDSSGGDSIRRGGVIPPVSCEVPLPVWSDGRENRNDGRENRAPTRLSDLFFQLSRDWQPLNKFLFDRKIKPEHVLEVARWFESLEKKRQKKARFWEKENLLKGPGIGWSFSFGYTPNLDEYVTDLTQPTPFFHQLVGREEEVLI